MKRNVIVTKLLNEGFTEKFLSKLTDKQITELSSRVLSEETLNIPKDDQQGVEDAKRKGEKFVTYEEDNGESTSLNLDMLVKKIALSSKYDDVVDEMTPEDYSDEFEFGNNFITNLLDDYVDHEQYDDLYDLFKDEYGDIILSMYGSGEELDDDEDELDDDEDELDEKQSIEEWVEGVVKENYHTEVTTKKEIYEMIGALSDSPDALVAAQNYFSVDEQSPEPSKPDTDAPVREKPSTRPGKPKRENPFEPKHKPKPKAELPKQLSFDSIGLNLKMAAE